MMSTNYYDTFIAVASDSAAKRGTAPTETEDPSIAFRTYQLVREHPYRYTSDEVLFTVHADRAGIPDDERPAARREFFSRPRACLRTSDLARSYGWGFHCDSDGRIALYAVESREYRDFVSGRITVREAARTRRPRVTAPRHRPGHHHHAAALEEQPS